MSRTPALLAALGAFWLAVSIPQSVATAASDASGDPQSDSEKTLYAIGMMMGQSLKGFALTEEELVWVKRGATDFTLGRELKVDPDEYAMKMRELYETRNQELAAKAEPEMRAYLAEQSALDGAIVYDSGLIRFENEPGEGPSPAPTDTVVVHYHGTLRDGTVFDSSVERGEPARFPLDRVIPCWTEGLTKMKVGGKSRLVCPPDIAYGARGSGRIPPNAALSFDVELLEIVQAPAAE